MTDRKTINEQLEALGRVAIEPVEPRLDDLEAQLLAAIGDDGEHRLMLISESPTRRGHRLFLVAAAAVCVLAISGALLLPKDNDHSIVIAAANDVSIILPDGAAVVGAAGLVLPDGAIIDVDGFVDVDGRRFGPGRYGVDDGEVVVLSITSDPSTTVQSVAPAPSVSPVSSAPPVSTRVSTTVRASDDSSTQTETTEVVRTTPISEEPVRTVATTVPVRTTTTVPVRTVATTVPVRTTTTVAVRTASTVAVRTATTDPSGTPTNTSITSVQLVPTPVTAVPVRRGSA
ncbi:hypothetical protein [Ilumatobacter sp.]|uniref:hypothetical protein n=1 Tax=Ilumatobacter sp. TaxID=1967498 RepID=UPI0037530EC6